MKKKRMTKAERSSLDRLQAQHGDDPDSEEWAWFVGEHHHHVHRGASTIDDDFEEDECECLVFGNDGFKSDVRVRREVAHVAARLEQLGIPILGFGVAPRGYSWAMRVRFEDRELMNLLIWDVWFDVCGGEGNPVKEDFEAHLESVGLPVAA